MKNEAIQLSSYVVKRALAKGFSEVAAITQISRNYMVKFSNNEVTVTQSWIDKKVSMYLVRDSRIYVVEDMRGDTEGIEKVLSSAREYVERIDVSELYAPLPEPSGKPLQNLVDKAIIENADKVMGSVHELIDLGLREGAEKLAGTLFAGYRVFALATSRGAELAEEKTFIEVYARAFRGDITGHWAWTSTRFNRDEVARVGGRAGRYVAEAPKAISIEPGRYEAILSPLVFGNLVNYIANSASALMLLLGLSMFTKYKPGTKIGSDKVTIIDDPHNTLLPGARGFDDEGIITRRNAIIDKGVFKTYLHNTKTAKKMNTESTGNAGWLSPRAWNIVIEPGGIKESEMFSEVRKGFFVLNNWYTRFQNWIEGQFSTVTRDLLLYIENGEVRGVVKRLRIAETFPHLLSNIVDLSKERYDIMWWEVTTPSRVPFALVKDIQFTKPEI